MIGLALTRLVDLVEAGYQIDREHSYRDRLVLQHMGQGPGIELLMSGMIVARDAPLWPPHISRPERIEVGEDGRFAEFIFAIEPPTRAQQFVYHLRCAALLLPMAPHIRRWMISLRWYLVEQHH
ncbi:hypothetical protein QH494_26305 [Sphingomonas sp. AR_OL41]|uniref:hypothetical protein n=1 Tax=Sphingomonas sp. AR_OL41 TaxID=3042729 RepID=UPI002481082E|nr:hypothetical protein [Sphingomonas sp. AR_OL41]MDH7975714.1 hypothetical protein [Sphingomonas sp. AR_OL41]